MKIQNKHAFFLYTITFLILMPVIFMPFLTGKYSFVWETDGISQHYPSLLYYGELLRGLLAGQGFPMVDFRVGMGFDTLTTLNYYVIGDPIALLSVFMTKDNGVFVYNALILLRFYLAGVSFLIFCRYWRLRGMGCVLGALMYVFCGYTFFTGVRHPYFLNPMIYLPFLLMGIEEVLRKEGSTLYKKEVLYKSEAEPRRSHPYLLILMSFICTLSNFYFLYIITMIAVIYVLFRFAATYCKDWKNKFTGFLRTGLKVGGYYLLGMAMAAVIFLPVIYAFMQNGRMDSKPEHFTGYLFYDVSYYFYALQGFFASGVGSGSGWIDLSFPTVIAVSAGILLRNKDKKFYKLRLIFLLAILALCIPAFGYFMNGFSYVTNRWDFLVAFIVAMVFTVTYQDIFVRDHWVRVILVLGVAGYGALVMIRPTPVAMYTGLILLLTVMIVFILQTELLQMKQGLREGILYVIVVLTLGFNGYAFYSSHFRGYAEQFLQKEEVMAVMDGAEAAAIGQIEDTGFFRIETSGDSARNEALGIGFYDVSAYFSLIDGRVTDYYKQLELVSQRAAFRIDHQDNRTILDALAGVKYFVSTTKAAAPFGFQLIGEGEKGTRSFHLFENQYPLSLGYTYQNYILREDYNKLSALEKQNALMYAVVLEEESPYVSKSSQDMSAGLKRLDYTIAAKGEIDLEEDSLLIHKAGSELTLNFDADANTELYVRFHNLTIDRRAGVNQTFKVKGEDDISKNVNIRNKYYASYFGKQDFLINLGYSGSKRSWAKITFPASESYSYDTIEIYQLDMNVYREQVQKLGQSVLQNVIQDRNRLEGDVTLNTKGIMVLSIPWSRGWSAYVDGQKAKLLEANVMYSALELPEGSHHITLTYRTPYLKEGIMVSGIAWAGFIIVLIIIRRRDKGISRNA